MSDGVERLRNILKNTRTPKSSFSIHSDLEYYFFCPAMIKLGFHKPKFYRSTGSVHNITATLEFSFDRTAR
jgi:hypothetical protein